MFFVFALSVVVRRLLRSQSTPDPQETRIRTYTSYLTRDPAGRPLTCRGVIEDSEPPEETPEADPCPDSPPSEGAPAAQPTSDTEWDVETEPFVKREVLAALTRPLPPQPNDWSAEEGTPTTSPGADKPTWPPARRLPQPR